MLPVVVFFLFIFGGAAAVWFGFVSAAFSFWCLIIILFAFTTPFIDSP
jgi:hypothetical protein